MTAPTAPGATPASRWHGVVTATTTPFTASGDLDLPRLRELLEHYVTAGVHGISVAGSQGEFYALDAGERRSVLETTVETVAGRVPVYGGTGGTTTRDSVRFTKEAEAIGVDVAMVITPYFISPSEDELVEHYRAVADASGLPVLAYNNPPRTGVNFTPSAYRRCLADGAVIGVKDSSGDLTQDIEYLAAGGDRVVFGGRDTIFLALLLHGGAGAVSPAACVFPRLMVRLYDLARAGDYAAALEVADALAPLRRAWQLASFPVVIKEAMAMVGLDPGPARAPIAGLSDAARAELAGVVEAIRRFETSGERR